MRSLIFAGVLATAAFFVGCAGSTSFVGEGFPSVTLAPGTSDTVLLEFEGEGSHSGEYEFTATVSSGDGLTATIEPTTAEVDGIIDIMVTITADDTAPAGNGSVAVEGVSGNNGALTTISVTVQEAP